MQNAQALTEHSLIPLLALFLFQSALSVRNSALGKGKGRGAFWAGHKARVAQVQPALSPGMLHSGFIPLIARILVSSDFVSVSELPALDNVLTHSRCQR